MKFCSKIVRSINFEYDYLTPCDEVFASRIPRFPFTGENALDVDAYTAFLHETVRDLNSERPSLCQGCACLENVDALPSLVPRFDTVMVNMHRFLCNCKCSYCFFWRTPKRALYEFAPQIRHLARHGYLAEDCQILWGGGEPGIVKDFPSTCEYIADQGYRQLFYTNAIHYSPAMANALRQNKGIVICSLDAGSPEVFRRIKGVDVFSKVLKNLECYSAANGAAVRIKYVLFEDNRDHDEIAKFLTICRKLGVGEVLLSLRWPVPHYVAPETYTAAAFFMEKAEEMGLRATAYEIPLPHFAVIKRLANHVIVTAPPLADFSDDTEGQPPCLHVGTRAEFQEALRLAGSCRVDTSLRRWPGALLFPKYSTACDCPLPEYRRRIECVRLRPLLSADAFEAFAADSHAHGEKLFTERLATLHARAMALREDALLEKARSLAGKDVYFWGYGQAYERYKRLFTTAKPQAILINSVPASGLKECVDGLPVLFAEDALKNDDTIPIVVFARDEHMQFILDYIAAYHPHYGDGDIIECRLFQ